MAIVTWRSRISSFSAHLVTQSSHTILPHWGSRSRQISPVGVARVKPSSHAARAAKGPGAVASAQPRGERRESRQCFSSCFLLLPPEALSTGAEGERRSICYRDGEGGGGGGGGGLRSSPPREGMTPPRIALPGVLASTSTPRALALLEKTSPRGRGVGGHTAEGARAGATGAVGGRLVPSAHAAKTLCAMIATKMPKPSSPPLTPVFDTTLRRVRPRSEPDLG